MLIETNKNMAYNLLYKLLKFLLTLPLLVRVERVFSSTPFVKNKPLNKTLNDCLIKFIEREFFLQVKVMWSYLASKL
jgi:hypothetical protein